MMRSFLLSLAAASALVLAGVGAVAFSLGRFGPPALFEEAGPIVAGCPTCARFAPAIAWSGEPGSRPALDAFVRGLQPWRRACSAVREQCAAEHKRAATVNCSQAEEVRRVLLARIERQTVQAAEDADRCRALACPEADCRVLGSKRAQIAAIAQNLSDLALEEQGLGSALEPLRPALEAQLAAFSATLERLALWATTPSGRPGREVAAEWRQHAEAVARLAEAWGNTDAPKQTTGGPHLTLLRTLAALEAAARQTGDAVDALGKEPENMGLTARWQDLGSAAGAAASALDRLEATLATAANRPSADGSTLITLRAPCGALFGPEAQRLGPRLAAVVAGLDQCQARGRCPAAPPALSPTDGRTALDRLAAPATSVAEAPVPLAEAPLVGLAPDLARYSAGDAIALAVDPRNNRCLRAGGYLAVLPEGGRLSSDALSGAAITGNAPTLALLEAPAAPGRYEIGVFGSREATLLASVPIEVDPAAQDCNGFAGRWTTDFGILVSSVANGALRGTYRREPTAKPGFLTGQVDGNEVHGSWSSELGGGGVHLTLAPDGRSFTGTWSDKPDSDRGTGAWSGTCTP